MLHSLSDVSTFKYSELMASQKITNIIKNIVSEKNGTIYVTEEQLEDVLYKIRHKSFNFSAKFPVLNLFKKGVIKLIYTEKIKLTVAVPFFKFKMQNGGFGVIVNISNYARMKSDGSITIDPLVLYSLMLSAAFSLVIEKNLGVIVNNAIPELYSSLFVNVMARIVNLDQVKRDKLKFISSKFLYMQAGVDEKSASVSAGKDVRTLDKFSLEQVDLSVPAKSYENLESLIDGINQAFPEFNGLSLAVFFDKWMRSYGESTAFACEYIPFFITVFISLVTNCNSLINVKAIEKEANRHNSKLVMLFNRIENIVTDMSQR